MVIKIKKILFILVFILFGLVAIGCEEEKEPVDSNKVDDCILAIEELDVVNKNNIMRYQDQIEEAHTLYEALNGSEKALVNNYDMLEEYYTLLVDEIKRQENAAADAEKYFKQVKNELNKEISAYAYANIELPNVYTFDSGTVTVTWQSSEPRVITTTGYVIPCYEQKTVTLTATMYYRSQKDTWTKEITVPKVEFNPLRSNKCVAYAYTEAMSWWKGFSEEDIKTLDVVNMSFAYITSSYTIDVSSLLSRMDLMQSYKNRGIRVCFSLRGGHANDKYFSMASANASTRKKLIDNIVNTVVEYNFDGVDIDWEYPGYYPNDDWEKQIKKSDDVKNFTLFIRELYAAMKAKNVNYLVTSAIPGGYSSTDRFSLADIADSLDYVNVMTYDLNYTTHATHHTALYKGPYSTTQCNCDEDMAIFYNNGFKKENIVLGAAFYGKRFTIAAGEEVKMGSKSISNETVTFTSIYNVYIKNQKEKSKVCWDEVAHAPYVVDYDTRSVYTYDSYESILDKCEFVKKNGYGGVMFWSYGEDSTGTLMHALYEGLKAK